MKPIVTVVVLLVVSAVASAFTPLARQLLIPARSSSSVATVVVSLKATNLDRDDEARTKPSPEETTEKYGLEAGVFQSLKEGSGESAKSLLKRYGIAYLATSIPLALVSFVICYLLVDSGVDVSGLLAKIGIESSNASEKAGTFALAYAAHKAASPIRFPPTVVLTPVVAKLIGKEPESGGDEEASPEK